MKLKISAVAFDIDGTLYPASRFNIVIFPFMLRHFRLMLAFNKARKAIRRRQIENPHLQISDFFDVQAELVSKYLDKSKSEVKSFLENEIYSGWEKKFKKVKPYAFVKESIVELKKAGLKIGILSDFIPEQKNDIWGILPFCDAVLGSEYVGALKPSEIPFRELSKKLGVPCNEILYVGNSFKHDILGASSAGMFSACIKNPFFVFFHKLFFFKKTDVPTFYFSSYKELLKIIL